MQTQKEKYELKIAYVSLFSPSNSHAKKPYIQKDLKELANHISEHNNVKVKVSYGGILEGNEDWKNSMKRIVDDNDIILFKYDATFDSMLAGEELKDLKGKVIMPGRIAFDKDNYKTINKIVREVFLEENTTDKKK